jgi:hypothetical protein
MQRRIQLARRFDLISPMSSSAVPGIKNAKVRLARKTGVGPDRLALSSCIDDAVTSEKLRTNFRSRGLTRQETQPDYGCCHSKFAEILTQ